VSNEQNDNLRRSLLSSTLVSAEHGSTTREISISGNQVLVTMVCKSKAELQGFTLSC
jgi:hypothetical protein